MPWARYLTGCLYEQLDR